MRRRPGAREECARLRERCGMCGAHPHNREQDEGTWTSLAEVEGRGIRASGTLGLEDEDEAVKE